MGTPALEPPRPPLSVILATTEPWPDLENCLAVLTPQIRALGCELLVGDGHGEALDPERVAASPWLSWIRRPGASVFDLRAEAAGLARGEIVALTEDHCVVAPDWCAQILEAFRLHPDASAVAGEVLNGSPEHLMDWANYLHSFGSSLPPYDDPERWYRTPPAANVAFRRSVLPNQAPEPGWLELELSPRLFQEKRFGMHGGMRVTHVQSYGFWLMLRMHFDNGRSTTGLRHAHFSRDRLPWSLYRSTVRGFSKATEYRRVIRQSLPLVFLLSCAHSLGALAGAVAGPGGSPARLR